MSVDSDNIVRLHENSKTLNNKIMSVEERIQILEKTVLGLQAELANVKTLTAHTLGRAIGSTVREDQ